MDEEGPLFLGVDLSTQALKASLLDAHLRGIGEVHVRFDTDVRAFGTQGGILPPGDPRLDEPDAAASPAALFVAAMDLLWERMRGLNWPLHRLAAMSAAGQQHASVYLRHGALAQLRAVDASQPLAPQLDGVFSRATVPNWQDATTLTECDELMAAGDAADAADVGGDAGAAGFAGAADGTDGAGDTNGTDSTTGTGGTTGTDTHAPPLAAITGSIAHTRFTAAQILRWRRRHPDEYARTERIQLVSNFVATLLMAGHDAAYAPIDHSDACGMNLLDMRAGRGSWHPALLAAVGGDADALHARLGDVARDPRRPAGHAGTWLQQRYGVPPTCLVALATGDNPATLQCLTPALGEAVLSLGTSDTVLLPSDVYAPSASFHTFFHPASTPRADGTPYFQMFVYKNASLAREWARDTACGGDWAGFHRALAAHPTPSGGTGFFWLKPEILPWHARGIHRFGADGAPVAAFDGAYDAAAMVHSQCLSFRARIEDVLAPSHTALQRVYVVGGAAENAALCQMLANVLGCDVARPLVQGRAASGQTVPYNYCSVGAACRARWVWECASREVPFAACVAAARGDAHTYEVLASPQPAHAAAFTAYLATWRALERRAAS